MTIFGRLIRLRAESIDRPWPDEFSPPAAIVDPIEVARRTGAPGNHHNVGATIFRGDLPNPVPMPGHILDAGPGPSAQVAYEARRRHGEGLFGLEPLIPEGQQR